VTEPRTGQGLTGFGRSSAPARRPESANLADILERVLDKGIVIAGDIQVNLLDIELLTIKLRLVIASVDRAKEMGIDWWEHDPTLSSGSYGHQEMVEENRRLRDRIAALEAGDQVDDESDEDESDEDEEVRPSVERRERRAVDRGEDRRERRRRLPEEDERG
jgi:Gas vesicle protein